MKNQLEEIRSRIKISAQRFRDDPYCVSLLAATKNQSLTAIQELMKNGQRLFGENRIQEAWEKWPLIKENNLDIELHLIGHLQTNKVKQAIALFDVIETLDSLHLAQKLVQEQEKQQRFLTYYIEINIGNEPQKNGIAPDKFDNFFRALRNFPLNIQGLMCIPPHNQNPIPYFKEMHALATAYQLPVISMGMSEDYELAIECGATQVRIGSALFKNA